MMLTLIRKTNLLKEVHLMTVFKQSSFNNFQQKLSISSGETTFQISPVVSTAVATEHQSVKVLFGNQRYAVFKNIWLRDNCKCSLCVHSQTSQKLLDTPSLNVFLNPMSVTVGKTGNLIITWEELGGEHVSVYDYNWLYRYGQCFNTETFESESDVYYDTRPPIVLWNRSEIWNNFPEISYNEVISGHCGLKKWLEMFYKYGIAIIRNLPPRPGFLVEFVKLFTYVKETHYGVTFDVIHEADPSAHPAFSGLHLHHHTDMNYREKSPGMQLLHCIKSTDPGKSAVDPGGLSFFVDGFNVAKWLQINDPSAFHILTSTYVRFQLMDKTKKYSQLWPVICLTNNGEISEIHYNNRTMGPLQTTSHNVIPFYQAYEIFSQKIRQECSEFRFHLLPGDVVAFNNRRILHGRTSFNPAKVSRHLIGCYVDIDEVYSLYDSFLQAG